MLRRCGCIGLVAAVSLVYGVSAQAGDAVRYVDASAPIGGDGLSWITAYDDLQDALDEAAMPGSAIGELWIAAGTYRPDRGTGDRLASFNLISGVALLGGFLGDETASDQRDPIANITILSGDLNDDDDAGGSNAENSYHVVVAGGTDATAVLDGLTVRAGHADGETPENVGGGMYCSMGSPTVRHCVFEDNVAVLQGAGVYNLFGDASFEGCRFENNHVTDGGGGGVFSWLGKPAFVNCDFIGNLSGESGAGLTLQTGSTRLVRCRFIGNVSGTSGGGLYKGAGDVVLTNCQFVGNIAQAGAAVLDGAADTSVTLINCLVHANTGTVGAGGIHSDGTVIVRDSTISHNESQTNPFGAGILALQGDLLEISNSIVWGNVAAGASAQTAQIFAGFRTPTVDYTCVQGWTGDWGGSGNIGEDPMFVDVDGEDDTLGTPDDDARLGEASPCEDTGDDALLPLDADDLDGDGDSAEPLPLDLDEAPRVSGAMVDMGAYERSAGVVGDLDGDGSVGPADLAILLGSWGPCPGCPADLNDDGDVGPADLATLLGNWG